MLDAAARSMLKNEDYDLFTLTMKAIKAVRDRRNDFAHGVWGWSDELKDALLWVSADDQIALDTALAGARPKHSRTPAGRTIAGMAWDAIEEHRNYIMVYRKPDLDSDFQQASEASFAIALLRLMLHPYEKEPDARRRELLALPLLRRASGNQDTPKSIPEAQP